MSATYQIQFLKGNKLNTFIAIADTIIPAAVADWALRRMPKELRDKLLLFVSVINLFGYFFGGKSFYKLSYQKRAQILRWFEFNKIGLFRIGFFGIKNYACMGYFTRENVWQYFDYDGPVLAERNYTDPIIRLLSQGKIQIEP
jgi:hypothetical protein